MRTTTTMSRWHWINWIVRALILGAAIYYFGWLVMIPVLAFALSLAIEDEIQR